MPKTKENKGITLIALVITIIVLLILAGVTINALSGNDSTPAKAQEATQKTDISTAKEDCILTATTAKADAFHATYVTNSANKTIAQSVIDALLAKNNTKVNSALIEVANDGTVTISTAGYEVIGTVDENGTLTFGEVGPLVPGIKDVPETLNMDTGTSQTINATLKGISGTITWTSSDDDIATVANGVITTADDLIVDNQPVNSATVTITATLGDYSKSCTVTVRKVVVPQVGDTVNYAPSGTYIWDKQYASSDQTGTETLNSESGGTYRVTKWKILSYDPNTKKVEMVPETSVGNLRLQGAQGYNNAVKMLDDACSNLYSTGSAITARSIKEEDFVKAGKKSQEGDNETTNDWTRMRDAYSNGTETYGHTLTDAYSNDNSWYPNIHALEEQNGLNNGATMGLSEQTGNLIERTIKVNDEDIENTKFKPSSGGIKPVLTCYTSSNYSIKTSKLLDSEKASVLLPNTSSTNYWVASRCVVLSSSYCNFYVRFVFSRDLHVGFMFRSNGGTNNSSRALFPVVSLNSELLVDSGTANTWNVNLD